MTHRATCRIAGPLLLLAFANGPALAQDEQVLASVNGKTLTAGDIERYRERRPESEGTPQELLQELINIELLVQDAEQKKLDEGDEFELEMAMTRRALLAQFAVREQIDGNPITEAEMRQVYAEQIG